MAGAMMIGHPSIGITGARPRVQAIEPTLNIAGEIAGMKNRCSEFSMPISAAATATSMRNGNITRVSVVVSSSLPGTAAYELAKSVVIGPANTIPMSTSTAGDGDQRVDHQAAQPPGLVRSLVRQRSREGGHEGGAHGPFGEQVAHQVGIRNAML